MKLCFHLVPLAHFLRWLKTMHNPTITNSPTLLPPKALNTRHFSLHHVRSPLPDRPESPLVSPLNPSQKQLLSVRQTLDQSRAAIKWNGVRDADFKGHYVVETRCLLCLLEVVGTKDPLESMHSCTLRHCISFNGR